MLINISDEFKTFKKGELMGVISDIEKPMWETKKKGLGDVDFIMDNVHCNGSETNIFLCTYSDRHNCGSSEGAGVVCESSGKIFLSEIYVNSLSFIRY